MSRTCIVVADATRARIFTYNRQLEADGPHEELREVADLVDPERHQRPSALFADDTGGNHVGHRGYSFDDHRQGHLDRLDAAFAKAIVAEATRTAAEHHCHDVSILASPRMLGALRQWLEPLRRTRTVTEFDRAYTQLPSAELRDRLAALDIIPPRLKPPAATR